MENGVALLPVVRIADLHLLLEYYRDKESTTYYTPSRHVEFFQSYRECKKKKKKK